MKVVLLKDIKRFGQKGQVLEVSDGYASSYLIPQGLARHAGEQDEKRAEANKEASQTKQENKAQQEKAVFDRVNGSKITIDRTANASGTLFESVHTTDITSQLAGLKPEHLKLSRPIKEAGEYTIDFTIGQNKGSIKLTIST